MSSLTRDNFSVNPPVGIDIALTSNGSDWLWAATGIYILSFFAVLIPSFTSHESKRVFNYTLSFALLVGSLAYYTQASDLGWSAVSQPNNLTRQLFYTRYINWAVSFPALALSLGLLSGISWTTILLNMFMTWFWVFAYLAAAYTTSRHKWGFFAFGTFAYVILAMSTLNESRESAARVGVRRDYMILSIWINLVWLLYPIAFGLSDCGDVIGVTSGFIFFGVLDVLLLPVASVGFLILSKNWDFEKLQLNFSADRGSREGKNLRVEEMRPVTDGSC